MSEPNDNGAPTWQDQLLFQSYPYVEGAPEPEPTENKES